MRNLILVAFVEPVSDGLVFPRTDWPLHITLLRFDVESPAGASGPAGAPAGLAGDVADLLAARAGPSVRAALGARLTVGPDAGFGRLGSVPVSLVEPDPRLQALHRDLFNAVTALGGKVATPNFVLDHYRPHISHHDGRRLRPGDAVVLDQIALVDMAPEGNHALRRILRLWKQGTEPGDGAS
jgi:hypothetical protein